MKMLSKGAITAAVALCASMAHGETLTGDNSAFVRQTTPVWSMAGNQLVIDQSLASRSLVQGVELGAHSQEMRDSLQSNTTDQLNRLASDAGFATQDGSANAANLILANNAQVQLYQAQEFNNATINAGEGSLASVAQIGRGNQTSLTVLSNGEGLVTQFGSNLNATLQVNEGGRGSIEQNGRNNTAALEVFSAAPVVLVQNGNGMNYANTPAVQVISTVNTGNIVITQTAP